ncbi:chromosome transmission fidelity 18-like protein [Chlorella sorokiniana]|uniref:Chromosome transmission fidelity 18-like protein n=1 Tax=Chlorella sorokiniana TaxID=3076 RepID=A0A2P6TPJ9_CHLSO|nr:chromosome transmission fidelity 18-like protein [Chlorella sorokiniana]|eukprot:PRW55958.1 chromosome transmission fidelity 18-like protein [Chlorella sorokiniana]
MEPLDDELEALLAEELEGGGEELEGGHKRRLDLASRADAARSLAEAPSSGAKRPRVAGAAARPAAVAAAEDADFDDDELLAALAQGSEAPSQSQQLTFRGLAATEEQALVALAGGSQPSQSVLGAAATTTAAGGGSRLQAVTAGTAGMLAASEEQHLVELAVAGTQPSQMPAGASGAAWQRSSRVQPAAPFHGGGGGDDFDPLDELDALLEMEGDEDGGRQPAAVHHTPAAAARQAPGAAAAAASPPAAAEAAPAPAAAPPQPAPELLPRRQYVAPAKEVFRISGASLACTSESGERVYCALEAAPAGCSRRADMAGWLRRACGTLLSEPIDGLLAAVEQDQYERALAETAAATAPGSQQRTPGRRRSSGAAAGGAAGGRASLWVQKYAPKAYIDLLSDEQINREVVRWLKNWDPAVFGTAAPDQLAREARGVGSRFQQQQRGLARGGGGSCGAGSTDPLGRPEHKVILVAGPPGLGKTTLAHVCAAHCGYRPLEINASDDRGGASLQARILDAVEMQSVMGERRPNCVIIDEIDGATGGAEGRSGIAALLKIVTAGPSKGGKQQGGSGKGQAQASDDADSDDEEAEGGAGGAERPGRGAGRRGGAAAAAGGRARQRLRPLMRPIICICNDLYAPALRPLRDVARVFHFKKPQAERLTHRLQAICAAEGLRCEKSTLRLLVERTDCDIRSCLNTLQFLAKKQSVVRQADLAGLGVGQKDMTKGAFQVWTELLQKKKAPGIIGRAAETDAQRAARLYGMLQDFGEVDLVLGGVHENVLGLRYFDMALQRTTAVLNHLGDADTFMRACSRTCDFGLLKYAPAPLVALSSQVAGPDRPNLQWPRTGFDAQRRAAANAAMLQGWMLGMAPAAAAAASTRSLVLEVLPHLMHIAAPSLRPVSQHLYSPAEQEAVRTLVDTLLHYNLRYCLDPTAEDAEEEARLQAEAAAAAAEGGDAAAATAAQRVRGAPSEPPLRFRPAVHRACAFPGMAAKGKHLPAAVRQTISHEADMEAIRRAEVTRWGPAGASASASAMVTDGGAPAAAPLGQANAQRPSGGIVPLTLAERLKLAQGRGGGAAAQTRERPAHKGTWLDQLKEQRQARVAAAAGGGEAAGGAGKARFAVLYKFHEGVTNAVKRGVLMRDLLA